MFNEQFKAFYNIEDACRDLGFEFYDNTEDPTLFDHREKRDQLKKGDVFKLLRDFKDVVMTLLSTLPLIKDRNSVLLPLKSLIFDSCTGIITIIVYISGRRVVIRILS
jgi:hypothetical protein